MQPLLLTIPECCRLAAIGRSSVYKLIREGRLPIRKIGRRTLIAAADLQDFVQRLGDASSKATP
jgi:excisionase family DNA binding protein